MFRTLFLTGFVLSACGAGQVTLEGDTAEPPLGSDSGDRTDSGDPNETGTTDSADTASPVDTGDSSRTDDSGAIEAIAVDLVVPATGLTTGGEQVVVYGGPFDESAVVHFGDAQGTPVSWTSTTVTVMTPSVSVAGPVDVVVTTTEGFGSARAAYRYEEPCTGLTASPDYVLVDNDGDEDITITFTGCATGITAEDDVTYDASFGAYGAEWTSAPEAAADGPFTLVLRFYAEPMISFATSFYPYLETDQGRVLVEVDPK